MFLQITQHPWFDKKKFEQKGVAYTPVFTVRKYYNNIQINNSGVFRDNESCNYMLLSHSTLST